MTPARVIDTQRLSTLAHEYEREIQQFFQDLLAIPSENGSAGAAIRRILKELEKAPFEGIQIDSQGLLTRIGAGKNTMLLHAQGAAGTVAAVSAGRLIHELGMYDDFILWVSASQSRGQALRDLHPDCMVLAEPTNLCIQMREAPVEGFLNESHPLVQAAIATYETLFELPPIISQAPSPLGPTGVPAIAFGAGGDGAEVASIRHLLKAAQFYAAFPTTYVEEMRRR
jgi:acetylornithine deacetylase/succinyl-diaminopimelate desuccinylase-like protein